MKKRVVVSAAFLGLTAVVLGAFGAHGLKKIMDLESLNSFKTGVSYQFYHAFFLFALFFLSSYFPDKTIKSIFLFTIVGILMFSGSIYFFSLNKALNWVELHGVIYLITPLGGTCLIISWVLLILASLKNIK